MLLTHENYQNRGIATHLVKKMIDEVRCRGLQPMVHIEDGNEKSFRFFSKLGFIQADVIQWISSQPMM